MMAQPPNRSFKLSEAPARALSGPASSSRPASYLSLPRVRNGAASGHPLPPISPCEPPKLMYFDAKSSRLLFTLAGVPFEDKRFLVDFSQSGDNQAPELAAGKKEGVFAANLGRVPVLYVGNDRDSIGDSKAIERSWRASSTWRAAPSSSAPRSTVSWNTRRI